MEELFNHFTKILKSVADGIFLDRPVRTALGALLGIGVFIVSKIVCAILDYPDYIEKAKLSEVYFMVFGIFIVFFPTIVTVIFSRSEFSEDIEKGFRLIKKARKDGVSDWQIRQMYLKICEKALDNSELKEDEKNT